MPNKYLSTDSYKGVRDFYPEDMRIMNHMFSAIRKTVESYGYEEYNASILEPAELYKAKSGEEIVNNETYTFQDRGGRDVTLRPEMTPTVARMVAKKSREIAFPARWYSIPNLFRYENPQKGRLREHYQLNVDIFGAKGISADAEIIALSSKILKSFGATDDMYEIRINSRRIMSALYNTLGISASNAHALSKIIDKKEKIEKTAYENAINELLPEKSKDIIMAFADPKALLSMVGENTEEVKELMELIDMLAEVGIKNVRFVPTLMRGFDYYTGIVFEVFDMNPDNRRSMFGGGRYDDLLSLFGNDKITATGFGMGDVTLRLFLEGHNLIKEVPRPNAISLLVAPETNIIDIMPLAENLRSMNIVVSIDLSQKKIGDQIKSAIKGGYSHIMVIGQNELSKNLFTVRELSTEKEKTGTLEEIASFVK